MRFCAGKQVTAPSRLVLPMHNQQATNRRRDAGQRTSKDVRERAQEAVLRQRLQRQRLLRHPPVALVDTLLAVGVKAAVQLEVEADGAEEGEVSQGREHFAGEFIAQVDCASLTVVEAKPELVGRHVLKLNDFGNRIRHTEKIRG